MADRLPRCSTVWLFAVLVSPIAAAPADGPRRVLPLDGTWEIAEGTDDAPPAAFDRKVPVPGLVDLAVPPFEEVGTPGSAARRSSFWYRRRFRVEGDIPAVALLKIHKAQYGCTVLLNGQPVGSNPRHFTPGWFDVRPHLKGGGAENELIVRVGGHREHPMGSPVNGWDFEKKRYIPGIYDAVELVLTGSPHVVRVETAPDVAAKSVRVRVELANPAAAPATGRVDLAVKEAVSGRVVGTATREGVAVPPAAGPVVASYPPHRVHAIPGLDPPARCTVEATIPIREARPWSPEDPFLYRLEDDAEGDRLALRFGLREFRFDPGTKRPMLNGKPHFLRGSNICILRFFEDPVRKTLPWDPAWVRRVIRGFKGMSWDSCRYCIGFPPEPWYDVADEEGLLVQDEFPIWLLGKDSAASKAFHANVTPEALAVEYGDWMFERGNHPCVFMWDAQNESTTDVTGAALELARGLDLQGRDWDNGWGKPQRPTDSKEEHPYYFTSWRKGTTLRGFGAQGPLKHPNPVLLNEYGWLWLNRDGTPCTLPVKHKSYDGLIPAGVERTADVYRRTYARTLAAQTEKFRADRTCAGVMHFCGLGYARPDGETSDNYVELDGPTFEPHFARYVRDAFAPTGVLLDLWEPRVAPGRPFEAPVVVVNDRDAAWEGRVRVRLLDNERALDEKETPLAVPPAGRVETKAVLAAPAKTGRYLAVAELVREGDAPVCSWRDVLVEPPSLALGRPVRSSSEVTVDGTTYPAAAAVDGKAGTRWSSEFSDPQWIAVDLGETRTVSRVTIAWEAAHAKAYAVQVSTDGESWKTVHEAKSSGGGEEEVRFAPVAARWVRIHGTARATPFGYSIWELGVYGG